MMVIVSLLTRELARNVLLWRIFKFDRITVASVAPITGVHTFVTDSEAPKDRLDAVQYQGIEVVIA